MFGLQPLKQVVPGAFEGLPQPHDHAMLGSFWPAFGDRKHRWLIFDSSARRSCVSPRFISPMRDSTSATSRLYGEALRRTLSIVGRGFTRDFPDGLLFMGSNRIAGRLGRTNGNTSSGINCRLRIASTVPRWVCRPLFAITWA